MPFSPQPLSRSLAVACLFATLPACNSSKTDAQSSAPGSGAAAANPIPGASGSPSGGASAGRGPAAPAIPAAWVDLDLTPAGKVWAGYTLKGPADAKVKKGFPDPTIEAGDYALSLSVTHTKKSTAALDTARGYGVSWKALTDTEELFEYQTSGEQDGAKFVRYNFDIFVKVDGKPVGCSGLNNQKERESLAPMMAACRTLRKK